MNSSKKLSYALAQRGSSKSKLLLLQKKPQENEGAASVDKVMLYLMNLTVLKKTPDNNSRDYSMGNHYQTSAIIELAREEIK